MLCPTCYKPMSLRKGKYGDFYFCKDQYSGCTQKTVGVPKIHINKSDRSTNPDWDRRSQGSQWEGCSCACGKNDFRIGSGYCVSCGHPPT